MHASFHRLHQQVFIMQANRLLYLFLASLLCLPPSVSHAAEKTSSIYSSKRLSQERLSADKLFLRGEFEQSFKAYIKLYQGASHPVKFDYLFLATKSLFATQKKSMIQQASESTHTLLAELETDHPLFYKSLLLRSMINYKLGHYSKALLQFEASVRYSVDKEGAIELGLCHLFQQGVGNEEASAECFKKLNAQFRHAYWAPKGIHINLAITGPDHPPTSFKQEEPQTLSVQQIERNKSKDLPLSANFYSIQVGAFGSEKNAQFLKENLSILGKPILILNRKNANGTLYLVRIQGFKTKSAAESYAQEKVAPQGLTYRVYKN